MLSKGILLLHDNVRPYTSRTTPELMESFGREVLDHAPYSPDLAPSDLHRFPYLKQSWRGAFRGQGRSESSRELLAVQPGGRLL
ncbi:hypothetical protein TNCV_173901 [Trichonephila clavipes]|nr:hypothetical protein TNCV_173901 [Trichonephila clavipes]